MILNKLYSQYKNEIVAGLLWGLIAGLLWGLIVGLLWGLIAGLLWGLIVGLLWGLIAGLLWRLVFWLVGGLVWGLVVILVNFPEAFPFLIGLKPILFLILGIIVLVEIVFLLDKSKPKKKEDRITFTIKRKLEAFFEVLLGLSAIAQIYILGREIDFIKYFPVVLKWIGYIGIGIIVIALIVLIFYIWIKLNSRKYEKGK